MKTEKSMIDHKPIIYCAGPYTASSHEAIKENINIAEKASLKLWKKGWVVITPHLNCAHFERYYDDDLTEQMIIEGELVILKRCDAMFVLKGWEKSKGTLKEIEFCKENNITIFYETDGIPEVEPHGQKKDSV